MTVRAERPSDVASVRDVVMRAYEAVPYSDRREHIMVEKLRGGQAYVSDLSLVAEVKDTVVGHIMLTKATIRGSDRDVTTLALAPLSVAPEYQRAGIGSKLVRTAHSRAAELGFCSIVLVGIPGYYERFGYQPLRRYRITLPFAAPPGASLILPLRPNALDSVRGEVQYAAAWLNH